MAISSGPAIICSPVFCHHDGHHRSRRRSALLNASLSASLMKLAMFAMSPLSMAKFNAFAHATEFRKHDGRLLRHENHDTFPILNATRILDAHVLEDRERWLRQTPSIARILNEGNRNYKANDGSNVENVNEQCTKILFGFLEGTTDAKDNCEGIMNAYLAADCGTIKNKNQKETVVYYDDYNFNDDYFNIFYEHQCCSSLRSHYYEFCDSNDLFNDHHLLLVAAVMLLCECAKSIVKKNKFYFLPEAAACMLVGMVCGAGAVFFDASYELAFDEEILMSILLPPIIFEAALSVNKREFKRRRGSIIIFAVLGTLLSSFITGVITYLSAKYFSDDPLPILDSLVFGALISSIDPVAILSVLTSLNMSETDIIYILVFGESLKLHCNS